MKTGLVVAIIIVVIAVIGGAVGFLIHQPITQPPFGSVAIGSSYQSTTTAATTLTYDIIKTGVGTFGGYTINVLGTGNVTFYDATTTNYLLRTGQTATTSLPIIGYIGASQAAGTYTYDSNFFNGLIAVFSGTQGTSSLFWR